MRGDLVVQLHFLGTENSGQAAHMFGLGPVVGHGLGHGLRQRDVVQQHTQILQRRTVGQAARCDFVGHAEQARTIADRQRVENAYEVSLIERAEHAAHGFFGDLTGTVGNRLIGQRQGIAHAARGRQSQQTQGGRLKGHLFGLEDVIEMAADLRRRHLFEIELQAARQHRYRNLLRIGGGENELDMLGRLFERLEHGIERLIGEHMHFVDHVDLEARIRGGIDGLLEQGSHFGHATIRGGIHFDVIDKPAGIDFRAGLTYPTGLGSDITQTVGPDAIECLGENARKGGLANTARAGKQPGMVQAFLVERMRKSAHDVLLTDESREIPGPPLARKDLVGHRDRFPG